MRSSRSASSWLLVFTATGFVACAAPPQASPNLAKQASEVDELSVNLESEIEYSVTPKEDTTSVQHETIVEVESSIADLEVKLGLENNYQRERSEGATGWQDEIRLTLEVALPINDLFEVEIGSWLGVCISKEEEEPLEVDQRVAGLVTLKFDLEQLGLEVQLEHELILNLSSERLRLKLELEVEQELVEFSDGVRLEFKLKAALQWDTEGLDDPLASSLSWNPKEQSPRIAVQAKLVWVFEPFSLSVAYATRLDGLVAHTFKAGLALEL